MIRCFQAAKGMTTRGTGEVGAALFDSMNILARWGSALNGGEMGSSHASLTLKPAGPCCCPSASVFLFHHAVAASVSASDPKDMSIVLFSQVQGPGGTTLLW